MLANHTHSRLPTFGRATSHEDEATDAVLLHRVVDELIQGLPWLHQIDGTDFLTMDKLVVEWNAPGILI